MEMELISNNYEWILGGIGVPILGVIVNFLFGKKSILSEDKSPNINNISTIIINNEKEKNSQIKDLLEDKSKWKVKILFIDDNYSEYKIVSILKKAGWLNTKSMKDVIDLDDPKVQEANIIFVDINGVGTTMFQDQGLGLAAALKRKYSEKKIVIYSAEPTGDRFHRALREVDDCLSKNAEPYQFIDLIEEFSKDIK